MTKRQPAKLQTVWLTVPQAALPAYEAALQSACLAVGLFLEEDTGLWRVEGVQATADEPALFPALLLAEAATGIAAPLHRIPTEAEGWLARTASAFPEQPVGARFLIRGTHLPPANSHRLELRIDAGVAFGSGEHGSTRGCLRALEYLAPRLPPGPVLDVGTGSGILAIAAARLLHRPAIASDIDPWSVRVASENTHLNRVHPKVRVLHATGLTHPAITRRAPYALIFANILARPLCTLAPAIARSLAPGGYAVLAGLLATQSRQVSTAYRAHHLRLAGTLIEARWTTLVLRRPPPSPPPC